MGKKLYVGNLPFTCGDAQLNQIFSTCGTVTSARVVTDARSGRSKGFGFVEMAEDAEAEKGIAEYNGADYEGRPMTVSEARPMVPREPGAGGRGKSPENAAGAPEASAATEAPSPEAPSAESEPA